MRKMSPEEIEYGISQAAASLRFEGLIVTEEEKEEWRKVLSGEKTEKEFMDDLLRDVKTAQ